MIGLKVKIWTEVGYIFSFYFWEFKLLFFGIDCGIEGLKEVEDWS